MSIYTKTIAAENNKVVPQTEPLNDKQKLNHAGGYSFTVSPLDQLKRFLCLGCESGTYYVSQKEHIAENLDCLEKILDESLGLEAVEIVRTFSVDGRTAKQDTIVFALAMFAACDNRDVRVAAWAAVPAVCRIPTTLFQFVEAYKQLCQKNRKSSGWGRVARRTLAQWYNDKSPEKLAMLMTKYAQRSGWSHKDVMRVCHLVPVDIAHDWLYTFAVDGMDALNARLAEDTDADKSEWVDTKDEWVSGGEGLTRTTKRAAHKTANRRKLLERGMTPDVEKSWESALNLLQIIARVRTYTDPDNEEHVGRVFESIMQAGLVREHIPTPMLRSKMVWRALLQNMPMTAMIRNLGKMTSIGLLEPLADATDLVVRKLMDEKELHKARIHPLNVLNALSTYRQGHGEKGSLSWKPCNEVVSALDKAFYLSFKNVKSTGKRFMLALDVSGSMDFYKIAGMSMTPRVASGALAMVTARTEPRHHFMAFTNTFTPLDINERMSLEEVQKAITGLRFGSTDCAQPMLYALEKKIPVDVFMVFTDSETYHGRVHPTEALKRYRKEMGIDAKLIVFGMTATQFTIADPDDRGMLDIAGFDANSPEIVRAFVEGEI